MDDNQIRRMELRISELEDQRRALQAKQDGFNRQYTLAAVVFIVGIVLCITPALPLGIFLVLISAASAITQTVKKRNLQTEIDRISKEISDTRSVISSALGAEPSKPVWK